jgi:TonB family protein
VVHQELPKVSRNSLATIHGHVKVGVRVTVDSAGNVINDTLADPGPSRYFARAAAQAARKWKFAPTNDKAPRQWLVRFEFARSGVTAHAVEKS